MEGGIRLLTKEMIKPSSPTPHHLRNYSLSFLDQIAPPIYMPFVFFYRNDRRNNAKKSILLKRSLSRALSMYYPLAGRGRAAIEGSALVVDCNDEGVPYQEAEARFRISDLILKGFGPSNELLCKLIPFQPDCDDSVGLGFLLGVQFTTFQCGGVAIGISLSHKLTDALSAIWFLKIWAAISRGGGHRADDSIISEFESARLFPPRDVSGYDHANMVYRDAERKIVTRRFVFEADSIEGLKARYGTSSIGKPPSKVSTITAFIWSRFVAATKSTSTASEDTTGNGKIESVTLRLGLAEGKLDGILNIFHIGWKN